MNMDIQYTVPQHLLKKAYQKMRTSLYKVGDYIRNCTACSQFISYRSIYSLTLQVIRGKTREFTQHDASARLLMTSQRSLETSAIFRFAPMLARGWRDRARF